MGQTGDLLRAALARGDTARYELRATDPDAAWTFQGECCRLLGEAIPQVDALEGQAPPPIPEPTPTQLAAVIGTYAGHGLAQDAYAGYTAEQVSWGPHHGLSLIAPADGHVELYTFGTPLNLALADSVYAQRQRALFDGWTCAALTTTRAAWPDAVGGPLVGLQTMYVAVFWPSAPLAIEGQRVGHLHYGHVRGDVRVGPILKDERFGTSWDSGIRFEPGVPNARAAHTHCCAGAGTTLSPNGDLPGRLAAVAQGWAVTDIGTVPGPQDYATARYCAGRLLSDFQQGGHPIPPLPQ